MTLRITPESLAAAYECLRAFHPFKRWALPPATTLKFRVVRSRENHGAFWMDGATPVVEVSERKHGHLGSLMETVGHEMIHLRQRLKKTETPNAQHNAEFNRLAIQVCKTFGWDAGQFNG